MLLCHCQVALPLLYHLTFVIMGHHSQNALCLSCCFAACMALPLSLSYSMASAMLCCLCQEALPLSCCSPWLDGFGFVIPCCLCYVALSFSRCIAFSRFLCHCQVALPLNDATLPLSCGSTFVILHCICSAVRPLLPCLCCYVAFPSSYHMPAVRLHCYGHCALHLLGCFATFRW